MRTTILITIALAVVLARPASCAEQFKDVPKDHWAAEYVQIVKTDAVMKGFPDATFKGNKSVTRYELAVALERMIAFIEQSLKPEVQRKDSAAAPSPPGEGVKSAKSKVESQDPAQALKSGGYIPANSPLLEDPKKTVSPNELAQALASVASRLIEKTIPPPND